MSTLSAISGLEEANPVRIRHLCALSVEVMIVMCQVDLGGVTFFLIFEKKPSSTFFLLVQLDLRRTLTETSQVNLNRKFCNILQHQLTQPFYMQIIQFRSETASAQKHVETMAIRIWQCRILWLPKNLGSDTRVFDKKG